MEQENSNIIHANKRGILMALTLASFLAAVDTTIVTMATPTISRDLGGFELVSLIFSAYLLTSSIATPIFGKLADIYGRKLMMNIGIVLFIVGSILCGLSMSMWALIGSRAIQGLGAASVMTISLTIVGDVFELEQRAKFQGIILTVWGVAGLFGPFLGGVLIDTLSWHWIFYINIPFGLLALLVLHGSLKERVQHHEHRIDYAGAVVLSLVLIVFLGIFTLPGFVPIPFEVYATASLLVTAGLLALFVYIETRAPEPLIAVSLLTRSSVFINLAAFLGAMFVTCTDVYLPIFLQSAQGYGATISGLLVLPITISWLIVSFLLGRWISRFGGKTLMIASNIVLIITALLFLLVDIQTPVLAIIMINLLAGFALGGALGTSTLVIQDSVSYEQRGAAVALNSLLKSLGQTIGIGIFGGVYNFGITQFFIDKGLPSVDPSNLYSSPEAAIANTNLAENSAAVAPPEPSLLSPDLIAQSISDATHLLFVVCLIAAVLALVASLMMPKTSEEFLELPTESSG